MNFSNWLKENAGWISLAGVAVSVLSATFSGFTLYFNFLADPDVRAEVGQIVLLNRKPFVGLNVTLRNSGAEQAVVNRGTLMFNTTELKLVMESIEPATWTYGDPSNDTPAKFTFFAPIILGKDQSTEATIWFEVDTGGARLFTDNRHSLTLKLYGDKGDQPVATREFSIVLTATNVSDIYAHGRELATLPVNVVY